MLDTNVWSMIGRAAAGPDLYRLLAAIDGHIVVPPSILLELARGGDPSRSQHDIAAILAGHRTQLATEAQSQSTELIQAIRRHQPGWLRAVPDRARERELNRFWTLDLWRRAARDWDSVCAAVQQSPRADADRVVEAHATLD